MTQLSSEKPELFKGRHFNHLLIIQAVRWYVIYKLSYRDVCDLMAERGVTIVHTTVLRWVQCFVPAFEKNGRTTCALILQVWEAVLAANGEVEIGSVCLPSKNCARTRPVADEGRGFPPSVQGEAQKKERAREREEGREP
ncbi:MAG TPA: hypothetical protein VFV58_06070 [Blastocatellia bacterium]|nr:hypothetical protein [Blastocatellia bacterium]